MQFRLRGLTANGYKLPHMGGNLPLAKNAKRFSAVHRALRGYNRGEAARAVSC